jgi:hypothetical protein
MEIANTFAMLLSEPKIDMSDIGVHAGTELDHEVEAGDARLGVFAFGRHLMLVGRHGERPIPGFAEQSCGGFRSLPGFVDFDHVAREDEQTAQPAVQRHIVLLEEWTRLQIPRHLTQQRCQIQLQKVHIVAMSAEKIPYRNDTLLLLTTLIQPLIFSLRLRLRLRLSSVHVSLSTITL